MNAPSLLRLFEPPDDFEGLFGWICGFSADAEFLEAAAERFAGKPASARARQGQIVLGLMLDPCHEPISVLDVPGVADLPVRSPALGAFRLMHAKLALLAFRGRTSGWRLRVIVSTGNWTQQTLEQSLDLAWCFDVDQSELGCDEGSLAQRCADLTKAHDMLVWLGEHYDRSLIELDGRDCETSLAVSSLNSWTALCAVHAGDTTPRLFDNRESSLLDGLIGYLDKYAGSKRRNLLALGSGFFEGGSGDALPSVPLEVINRVRDRGLLTRSTRIDIYVNEQACQSVATSMAAIESAGWSVWTPARPQMFGEGPPRGLHAKFIFSANCRHEGGRHEACTSAWMYFGSGNLTQAGLLNRAGRAGNFEAGVFLQFSRLPWWAEHGSPSVEELIPLRRDDEEGQLSTEAPPSSGDPMPLRPPPFVAGPVAFLRWRSCSEGSGKLFPPAETADRLTDMVVLDPVGSRCDFDGEGWPWRGTLPRQVAISWSDGQQVASVPVVDELGRVAAGEAPPLDLVDLAWHLTSFPTRADEDDDGGGDQFIESAAGKGAVPPPLRSA